MRLNEKSTLFTIFYPLLKLLILMIMISCDRMMISRKGKVEIKNCIQFITKRPNHRRSLSLFCYNTHVRQTKSNQRKREVNPNFKLAHKIKYFANPAKPSQLHHRPISLFKIHFLKRILLLFLTGKNDGIQFSLDIQHYIQIQQLLLAWSGQHNK